jgi:deoxyribodipyrimidine photo-lyase
MGDNALACRAAGVAYYPLLASDSAAEFTVLSALANEASVVVGDDYPIRDAAETLASLARAAAVRLEAVDRNGLMPIRTSGREFVTAHSFRRFLQRELPDQLPVMPLARPLAGATFPCIQPLPAEVARRSAAASGAILSQGSRSDSRFQVDSPIAVAHRGGTCAARDRLQRFVRRTLLRYAADRNKPDADATSGLSADLHFGYLATHEVFHAVASAEEWSPHQLADKPTGTSEKWWGMSPSAEAFLDELVTWRELSFNCCAERRNYDDYDSLPQWARNSLAAHAGDSRPHQYTLEQLERAETHDALWNAAQRQLVREGRIHNYLRMVWGKKILEWTATPQAALEAMIELNNKYALDGHDPNSYGGIFWVLGRYDRPWWPERPIFGVVRYMSSANTARKVSVKRYLNAYGPEAG